MLNWIIFHDEITLWWDLNKFEKAKKFQFYLDDNYHGETTKTHYTFSGLDEKRAYHVRVEALEDAGNKTVEEYRIETKKRKRALDITKPPYNAVGDGKTLNTANIQKALDNCDVNTCVYFPKGEYLTGALNVYSDTEIYLDEGATLQGTANVDDYLPKIKSRFEGTEMMCYRSLINMGELDNKGGYNCKNVVIRGKGTIYGGGKPLAECILETEKIRLKEYLEQNAEYVKTCENSNTIPGRARGRLINMSNCENVILSGITVGYGASWNIHFVYSKDIFTYGCTIRSDTLLNADGTVYKEKVWNGDGWDPDSSENCVVFDTLFDTYDDGIAIKSGKNPEGNIVNRPTKNIYVFDCRGKHGVAVGSEISGGVENVYVWDCEYLRSSASINLKTTVKRGGYIKNVVVKNCRLMGVSMRTAVGFNNDGDGAGVLTKIKDLYFENLQLIGNNLSWDGKKIQSVPIFIDGFEGEENHVNNVILKNVRVEKLKDGDTQKVYIKNVRNLTTDIYFE